jgi:hypothetical protein
MTPEQIKVMQDFLAMEAKLALYEPVIEAAKALTLACVSDDGLVRDIALAALFVAVEALERVEEG